MNTQTYIFAALALVLYVLAFRRKDGSHNKGLLIGAKSFRTYLLILVLAFFVAGMLQVALPASLMRSWLGAEAGWRGIVIGSFAGMFVAAAPYAALPIFASILQSGAGIGTAVALLTSYHLLNFSKLPFELAILGPRFTWAHYTLVFFMPLLAGFIAHVAFGGL